MSKLTVDDEVFVSDVLVEECGDLAGVPARQVQSGPAQQERGVPAINNIT